MSKVADYIKFIKEHPEIEAVMVYGFMIYLQDGEWTLEANSYDCETEEITTEFLVEEYDEEVFIRKCNLFFNLMMNESELVN